VRAGYGTTLDDIGGRAPRVDYFQSQGPLSEAWGKALMSRRCGVGRSVPFLAKRARQFKGLFKQGSLDDGVTSREQTGVVRPLADDC
jgi:hypothetical protein